MRSSAPFAAVVRPAAKEPGHDLATVFCDLRQGLVKAGRPSSRVTLAQASVTVAGSATVRPHLAIWFHQPLALVDSSQGSRQLERIFSRLVGLPTRPLTDYPGSITNWENHRFPQSTAFVTELPPGRLTHARASRYAHAIFTLARR